MNKKTPAFEMELNNFEMFQNKHGAKYSELNWTKYYGLTYF